jgi:hydroxyacylglutathione hydrolase
MDILVSRVVNRPVNSNSFVIYQAGSSNCIIVDPGTNDCAELLDFLIDHNLIPEYIFLTHEHFDHLWGVNRLKDTFGCRTVCSKDCAEKIVNRKKNMSVFYDQVGFQTYEADILLEDICYSLTWNNKEFRFLDTPGHTTASVCISVEDKLFTGDTIIKHHKTVIKFPGGSKVGLMNSLDSLFLMFRHRNITVYPGHGESFLFDEIAIDQLV